MIKLFSLLTAAAPDPGKAPPSAGDASQSRIFASLLSLLRPEGDGLETPRDSGGAAAIDARLAEAEAALTDPDLTDGDLAEIVGPLISDLVQMLAAAPEQLRQLRASLPEIEAEVQEAADPPSWRTLAAALPALREHLSGAAPDTAPTDGLSELVARVLREVPELTRPSRGIAPVLEQGNDEAAVSPADAKLATVREGVEKTASAREGSAASAIAALSASAETVAAKPGDGAVLPLPPVSSAQISMPPIAPAAPDAAGQPRTAPALPSSEQILGQVRAQLGDDGQIRIALKPEGLGRVEIALAPDDNGQLRVTVRADQPGVLSLLRADRDGLLTLLREGGHPVDARGLSFSDLGTRDPGQGQAQSQRNTPFAGEFGGTAAEEMAEPDPDPRHQTRPQAGGVDIQV